MKIRQRVSRMVLRRYKEGKQKALDTSLHACMAVARQTVAKTKYAFLISQGKGGWPSSRLVEPIMDEGFVFWIGTNPTLRKVGEIVAEPRVTLAYGNMGSRANLVAYGMATIHTEPELRRRYWKGEWRLFFPDGPLGEDYVLIRIEAKVMEVLSFRGNLVPEPFGLHPVTLAKTDGEWQIETLSS